MLLRYYTTAFAAVTKWPAAGKHLVSPSPEEREHRQAASKVRRCITDASFASVPRNHRRRRGASHRPARRLPQVSWPCPRCVSRSFPRRHAIASAQPMRALLPARAMMPQARAAWARSPSVERVSLLVRAAVFSLTSPSSIDESVTLDASLPASRSLRPAPRLSSFHPVFLPCGICSNGLQRVPLVPSCSAGDLRLSRPRTRRRAVA